MNRIRIKAGQRAYKIIKDGGFNFDSISSYFGPAVGPRWLLASGFDLTLLTKGILGRSNAVHLIGSSAGAWRFAAWLQPQATECYRKLIDAYINVKYFRDDTPSTVFTKLTKLINEYLEDDALPFALANKKYRLSIITARGRGLVASENLWLQKIGLITCYLFNYFNRNNIYRFTERVVFYNGGKPAPFLLKAAIPWPFCADQRSQFQTCCNGQRGYPSGCCRCAQYLWSSARRLPGWRLD